MSINYNITGSERKALVEAISEILDQPVAYAGAPTFAYTVGSYIIDRNGALSYPTDVDTQDIVRLTDALKERGYEPDPPDTSVADASVTDTSVTENGDKLSIEVPLEGFNVETLENLRKIVVSKETLMKKALNADDLPIKMTEDKLCFPWFTLTGAEGEADAYARFVCALGEMAKKQKRVTAKEQEVENDKFTMRIFLIRLGFIGPEYKSARNILLRNLTGNSSWKNGPPEKTATTEKDQNTEMAPAGEAHPPELPEQLTDSQLMQENSAPLEYDVEVVTYAE